jgi:phenylacetate-CoA ligase
MTANFAQAWTETYRYAAQQSPFYRAMFRGFTDVPRLEEVPTVDKRTLSEQNLEFLSVPRGRVAEIVTTSGTTGRPLLYMLTEADLRRLAENERQSFDCAGLTAEDTVLVAVTLDRCFIAGLAYWLGLQSLGCAVARVGPSSPVMVLEMMERLQPTAIVSVPSFLRMVADKARVSVKKAICIGEPVRQSDFSLNATGQAIESNWGARVFATYGITELASSLCECAAGAGGHLHTDLLHLEILDDAGRPVPDGEVGEVVATTFGVEAMPLIRYRTGDCAALFRGPCTCGRATPRLGPILGRKDQKLKVKGTTLFPSALQAALESVDGLEAFVIVARAESALSDSVEVLIHGAASMASLREACQGRAKIVPHIRQAPRDEIEALQMPANARKRRTFVDLR